MRPKSAVIIGDLDATRRTCAALEDQGYRVLHLLQPSDEQLCTALTPDVDAVVVVVRGDVTALRYALFIEHRRPGIRLVVTVFDRTVAEQLLRVVPNCVVTSPADIAVPSLLWSCLGQSATVRPARGRGARVRDALLAVARQGRPHDGTTKTLVAGLLVLLAIVVVDCVIGMATFHESAATALHESVRTVATVGSGPREAMPSWYLVYSALSMAATIVAAAVFTASVVNYLHSDRTVRLFGRCTVPARDHVIVVGLGQVGLRLCIELRAVGVSVVAVERDPSAPNLRLATQFGIPVLQNHGEDRAALVRAGLPRALAIAAVGSDDLDNVEVAITALGVSPSARVVIRAGESDVIAETRSLFGIGEVCNVSALTAAALAESVAAADGAGNESADGSEQGVGSALAGAAELPAAHAPTRCGC